MNYTDNRIEEVINCLENIQRASPGPFFLVRLQRLRYKKSNSAERKEYFFSKPILAGSILLMVFLIDGTALKLSSRVNNIMANKIDYTISDEFGITSNDFYGFENGSTGNSDENQ